MCKRDKNCQVGAIYGGARREKADYWRGVLGVGLGVGLGSISRGWGLTKVLLDVGSARPYCEGFTQIGQHYLSG